MLELTARSGLPTSPRNTVSPVNNATEASFLSLRRKQELSKVWPGVWITVTLASPNFNLSQSFASVTLNLLAALLAIGPITTCPLSSLCPEMQSAWQCESSTQRSVACRLAMKSKQGWVLQMGSISRHSLLDQTQQEKIASSVVLNWAMQQPQPVCSVTSGLDASIEIDIITTFPIDQINTIVITTQNKNRQQKERGRPRKINSQHLYQANWTKITSKKLFCLPLSYPAFPIHRKPTPVFPSFVALRVPEVPPILNKELIYPAMALRMNKRLQKQYESIQKNNQEMKVMLPNNDLTLWHVSFLGAKGTLYQGESFTLQLRFANQYPIESPEVIFIGHIPIHEHIYSNGFICLSILYDEWSPALTVSSICLSVLSMLSSAPKKVKPPNDAQFVKRAAGRGPKAFLWSYHDDKA